MKLSRVLNFFVCVALGVSTHDACAQSTAFTYQGRLNDGTSPANGSYDVVFSLFATDNGGSPVAEPVTNAAVVVSDGLFTTTVDFGTAYTGADRWLEIAISTNGINAFSTLMPRQALTPAPTALFANSASNVSGTVSANQISGNLPAAQLTGTLALSQLPTSVITNDASGVNFTGTFSGNGAGITNVDMRNLAKQLDFPVVAWGANSGGIPIGLSNVVALAGGNGHSLALKSDGTVVAWGANNFGQANVPSNLSNVVSIAAGNDHCLALKDNGTLVRWGDTPAGAAPFPAGQSNFVAIAEGYNHSLALKNDGTIAVWGDNTVGQASVPAGLNNVAAIAAGFGHNLTLKSNGTVVAWGWNTGGQTNVPAGLSNVIAIAAGRFHSLALISDGTVTGWGDNSSGQISAPAGLSNVVAIAAGFYHSLALRSDGTVVAWGRNDQGQRNVPAGLSNVVTIAAGSNHSMAARRDFVSAQVALLTENNVFEGTITAASFSGDGSDLTSLNATNVIGTLKTNQIPDLDAGKISSGIFAASRIPDLDAGKITSGTLSANQIPSLEASKISSGVFTTSQIPNLDASKIATGTLADARLSTNVTLLHRSPQTFTGTNTFTNTVVITGTFLGSAPYLKYTEQYAKGTAAGGNAAGVNVREFNTEATDSHNLGALSGSNIALAAGTYYCRISAPAYRVDEHQIRLKTTGGTVLLYGTSEFSDDALSPGVQSRSQLEGQFTIGSTTTLQVEHFTTLAKSGNGLGLASSATWTDSNPVEVFSVAEFWRIK